MQRKWKEIQKNWTKFILPRQQNRADLFPVKKKEEGRSYAVEKAVPCCTLMIFGMHTIGFLELIFSEGKLGLLLTFFKSFFWLIVFWKWKWM